MNQLFNFTQSTELSVTTVLTNLVASAVLSLILAWHFVKFGSSFSNRHKFAAVLPTIALTTVLVISVVKASLALSLGLVGALSIVRFRTPVKEPEELAYLFLAIAVGLGLGADQRLVATMHAVEIPQHDRAAADVIGKVFEMAQNTHRFDPDGGHGPPLCGGRYSGPVARCLVRKAR